MARKAPDRPCRHSEKNCNCDQPIKPTHLFLLQKEKHDLSFRKKVLPNLAFFPIMDVKLVQARKNRARAKPGR
jgi:hypothetical protein